MRVPMPVVFAVVCGVACRDTVSPVPALSPSAQVAVSGDSIRLTYICGNTFRLRNANDDYVEVKWDIFNTPDSGRLVLPKRPAGQAFSQVFVTANRRGTMRVFFNGRLEETKANGNQPACATVGQETPWPSPGTVGSVDRTRIVTFGETPYSRVDWVVVFTPDTPEQSQRTVIASTLGAVTAVYGSIVTVRVPDLRRDSASLKRALDSLAARPGVARAYLEFAGALVPETSSRFPRDEASQDARTAWTSENDDTWWQAAIGLPAAWGCVEPGGGARLGIVEWRPPRAIGEIAANTVAPDQDSFVVARYGFVGEQLSSQGARFSAHATQVAGMAAARADNGIGTAGVLFDSPFQMISLASSTGAALGVDGLLVYLIRQVLSGPKVVSLSIDATGGALPVQERTDLIARYVFTLGFLLPFRDVQLVVATGNDKFQGSVDDYRASVSNVAILRIVLLELRRNPALRDRMILVTGSNRSGALASPFKKAPFSGANVFEGITDVAAPAEDITVLDTSGVTASLGQGALLRGAFGTSLAAPQVAATLAAMLQLDPSLSANDRKRLLLAGARTPRLLESGQLIPPTPVHTAGSASSPVFQLNAYGALSLVSSRSSTAPLCGQRIATDSGGTTLRILRDSLPVEILPFPAGLTLRTPVGGNLPFETEWASVAQGGRLISINAQDGVGDPYLLTFTLGSSGWTAAPPMRTEFTRGYLERDTAYLKWTEDQARPGRWWPVGEVRRKSGGKTVLNTDRLRAELSNRDQQFRPSTATSARVSPDGSALAVTYTFGFADFCSQDQPIGAGLAVIAVQDSAPPFYKLPERPTDCTTRFEVGKEMAWHPSSQLAAVLTQDASFSGLPPAGFKLQAYRRTSGVALDAVGPPVAGTDSIAVLSGIRGDGALAQLELLSLNSLQRVCQARPVLKLDVVTSSVVDCAASERTPLLRAQPNSVALDATAIRRLQRTRWRATLPSP